MLTPEQEQQFRDHLRAVNARETCPACDAGRWTIDANGEIRMLLRSCACCGHIMLFDPRPLGWHVVNHLVSTESGFEARSIVKRLITAEDLQSGTIRAIDIRSAPLGGLFTDYLVVPPREGE